MIDMFTTSANGPTTVTDRRWLHTKCQESYNCNGPGCRRQTGKTKRKRKPTYVPDPTGIAHLIMKAAK